MGLNSAVNRHIPAFAARNDHAGITRVVSTSFAFFISLGVVLAIATIAIWILFEDLFALDAALLPDAEALVLVVGLSFSLAIAGQHFQAVLSGYQRYDTINYTSLTIFMIRTGLVVALLNSGFNLVAMGICYGVAEIAAHFIPAFFVQRLTRGKALSIAAIDFALLRQMLTYGFSSGLYNSGAVLAFKSADLIIGSLIAAAAVPRFFIAASPVLVLITLVQVFSRAIKPAISDLDARDDDRRIEELALLSQKYTLILILPSVAFLILMGRSFLSIWVGDQYPDTESLDELAAILAILALGTGIRLTQFSNFMVLVGKGLHRTYGITALVTTIACVACGLISVRFFDGGLVAVAWSCCVPMALSSGLILPAYFSSKMGMSARTVIAGAWFPAMLGAGPGILVVFLWQQLAPPQSWIELGLGIAGVGALTGASSWLFSLRKIEQDRIRRLLRI